MCVCVCAVTLLECYGVMEEMQESVIAVTPVVLGVSDGVGPQ